jgi:hypothetical protein
MKCPDDSCSFDFAQDRFRRNDKGECAVLPEGIGKNQSKSQGVKSKKPFFHNFFYPFS